MTQMRYLQSKYLQDVKLQLSEKYLIKTTQVFWSQNLWGAIVHCTCCDQNLPKPAYLLPNHTCT